MSQPLRAAAPESVPETSAPRKPSKSKGLLFLSEFFRSPFRTGALHESPPRVAKMLADELGLEHAANVVEFGPGTGPVTREIVARIPRSCQFFAIEKNPRLAKVFRERNPGVSLVEGSIEGVRDFVAQHQMGPLDVVVSSVPWILLPKHVQEKTIQETIAAMRPGGRFSMITYRHERLKIVRKFIDIMRAHFAHVEPMHPVRSRFGLAYVYRATR